ncbi:TetR-like C-terminal domain-containing protein [Brevibacterium oceani]|uniref:TetR-like C-terminal domain-containing protein n=1 Tax=Brevibacterium oceani TaxID=358099 RepID=UPI002159E8D4|nr:TetR-like C-terminal domain-containing protein [Brevibacterium oceani]
MSFGLRNPGFYTLMYGKVRPGHTPADQSRPSEILRALTAEAAAQGRLVVDSRQAAAHILATNVGLTLSLIILGHDDQELSVAIREGVLSSITGIAKTDRRDERLGHSVIEYAVAHPEILGSTETQLLVQWTQRLGEHVDRSDE